ncbi:hypothetical protein ONS96_013938 [Cadophora gregata f. sp. sojae]|nr:hypothetical protein ONS96_013938 [Cadophora gregata f. sp. sojae]
MDSDQKQVGPPGHHHNEASEATQSSSPPCNEQIVAKHSLGFLDLPYDIRFIIYKICFVRHIGIVPAVNRYRRRLRRKDKHLPDDGQVYRKYSAYRYQWEGNPQRLPQWSTLTKITLHKNNGDDSWGYRYNPNDYDEDGNEIERLLRKTDDERISEAVENSGLYVDQEWRPAMNWIQLVGDRAKGGDSITQNATISDEKEEVADSSRTGDSSSENFVEAASSQQLDHLADQLESITL